MAFGVAVVGLSHWYTAFGVCETADASTSVQLVGICDPVAERQAWAREKHPSASVSASEDALLARDDVHLVAICAPTAAAPAIALKALAAGKHVLAVKPSARTLAELDTVIEAAEQAGRFFGSFEGLQRLNPRAQELRTLVRSGAIGTPLSFHQVGHGGLPSPWPGKASGAPSWWIDPEQVATGAWLDHAIYAIDQARYVFGGEVDHVAGVIGNRLHAELPLEDYGAALMRLQAGTGPVTLVIEDTWSAAPGGGAHWLQILGTEGSVRPDGKDWVVTRHGKEERYPVPDAPFFHLDALAAALQSGEPLPFGPEDARANLAACLSFYANAAR